MIKHDPVNGEGTEKLRYSGDHCWARREANGNVAVGLTDFAQSALGAIVFVGLPDVGADIDREAILGEVESTKAVSEIYAPLSGRVSEVNTSLASHPGTVNSDPYGAGWVCVIEPRNGEDFEELLDPSTYRALIDTDLES
ncbi:MAG TPA: glycine cleavage system protein GcvH [Acidimicrobiales bacterium]|jgi:glycine cleavage system H protein|nr:glycine cleavage system protein GcvH [Acidimicrobiales bacterium]